MGVRDSLTSDGRADEIAGLDVPLFWGFDPGARHVGWSLITLARPVPRAGGIYVLKHPYYIAGGVVEWSGQDVDASELMNDVRALLQDGTNLLISWALDSPAMTPLAEPLNIEGKIGTAAVAMEVQPTVAGAVKPFSPTPDYFRVGMATAAITCALWGEGGPRPRLMTAQARHIRLKLEVDKLTPAKRRNEVDRRTLGTFLNPVTGARATGFPYPPAYGLRTDKKPSAHELDAALAALWLVKNLYLGGSE